MNILVTLNSNYVNQLIVMLTSLLESNKGANFIVYIAHTSLSEGDFQLITDSLANRSCEIVDIQIPDNFLEGVPVTNRYPKEMYYRIFAAHYLPKDLDRILYLDPDLVVINSISELYNIDFKKNYFAAASHVNEPLDKINRFRLNMPEDSSYVNSGVMMMNLGMLRKEQKVEEVFSYIEEYKNRFLLPDQDVLNGVYGDRILAVDPKIYNLSERYYVLYNLNPKNWSARINLDWVRKNTVIIHYCGKNKPWNDNYKGELDTFYKKYESMVTKLLFN